MSKQWVEVTVAYETNNDYGRAAWDAMPGALSVKHIESVTPYPAHGEQIQGGLSHYYPCQDAVRRTNIGGGRVYRCDGRYQRGKPCEKNLRRLRMFGVRSQESLCA